MMESAPQRPPVLVAALVVLPLAAFLFGMTEQAVAGTTGLTSVALLSSLLAIRFNAARVTSLAVLALQTLSWLPGALKHVDDEAVGQAASYSLIGTGLFVGGAVLACLPESAQYYREAAQWRIRRKSTL
ncbi:hypothetical protein [Amycolatopsis sp. MtRt-6]|uniref:hypothetical protein n=1 Tax=Amycolatopsis sp. MtRt-6 TaxID=2792782 RepID=UPI001A8DD1B0|nr:hypothetical protein [Amycolatopsis sp. MtRt-6]